ncbi:LegC family aminotransferase [Brevibacillus sp. SAFN-007a]|uniref:LegC family aminotransferase n=1 Tax=Brevibacillus sp. SAFN-007a TaxID=3436862 RepID=UPI003F7D5D9F
MKQVVSVDNFVSILKQIASSDKDFVALHEPCFQGNEWAYVKECLDTGWVSSVGKYVDRFEEMLQEFTGVKRAVAVVNGTAALHICLKVAGVEPEDEVLIPTLTFIATANAVVYSGAIPHFVDVSDRTLGIDSHKLEDYLREISEVRGRNCYNRITGRRIKAVIPMHTFGHPSDLDGIVSVCERFQLELIEDAAESLGSYYKGRHTGNWGRVSALSFNGNKIITTGGGGAILTNDEALGQLAKHLTTTAKKPHKWEYEHDQIGYNYRMPNINAALGCAQLEQLPTLLKKKRKLAHLYREAFSKLDGLSFFWEQPNTSSNFWLNAVLLERDYVDLRDTILEKTNAEGIMTRPAWKLLHTLQIFKEYPSMKNDTAKEIEKKLINIPSSAGLIS